MNTTVTFRISISLKGELKRIAEEDGISMGEAMRNCILREKYVRESKKYGK